MSFQVIFGSTSKRYNSTFALHDAVWHEEFRSEIILKEKCSLLNPIFIINLDKTKNINPQKADLILERIARINYCHCPTFLRYYWVDSPVWITDRIVEIPCHVDVLASHSEQFRDYKAYIQYTSNVKYSNTTLDDSRLVPDLPEVVSRTALFDNKVAQPFDYSNWVVVLTAKVLYSKAGVIRRYILKPEVWDKMMMRQIIKTQNWWDHMEAIFNQLGGNGSLADYILGARLIPISYDTIAEILGEGAEEIHVKIANVDFEDEDGSDLMAYAVTASESADLIKLYPDYYRSLGISSSCLPLVPGTVEEGEADGKAYFLRGSKYLKLAIKHPGGCNMFSSDIFTLTGETTNMNPDTSQFAIKIRGAVDYLDGSYYFEVWNVEGTVLLTTLIGDVSFKLSTPNGNGTEALWTNGISKIANGVADLGQMFLNAGAGKKISDEQISTVTTTTGGDFVSKMHHRNGVLTGVDRYSTDTQTFTETTRTPAEYSKNPVNMGIVGDFTNSQKYITPNGAGDFASDVKGLAVNNMINGGTKDEKYSFSIIGTLVVPAVCHSTTTYQEYAERHGYPCARMNTINDHIINGKSVYIQCSEASLPLSNLDNVSGKYMHIEEVAEVNRLLNTGIFLEGMQHKSDE